MMILLAVEVDAEDWVTKRKPSAYLERNLEMTRAVDSPRAALLEDVANELARREYERIAPTSWDRADVGVKANWVRSHRARVAEIVEIIELLSNNRRNSEGE